MASGSSQASFQDAVRTARWECEDKSYSLVPGRTLLKFDLDPQAEQPRFLITRRTQLSRLQIQVIDSDGSRRDVSYRYDEMQPAMAGGFIKARLPALTDSSRQVIVGMDEVTSLMTLQQAYLAPGDPGDNEAGHDLLLLLAALCGMLLMPLLFNAAFYRVLREPFVLWHTALTISLMLTIIVNSGLSMHMVALSLSDLSRMTTIVFGLSVAAGGMFAHSFIEADRLNPVIRKALPWAALASLLISFAHANFPFVLRPWQSGIYYLCYLPILILYISVLVDALRRGSRAARFQLVGWLPLLGVGIIRIVSQFAPGLEPTDAMTLFYVGCVFEVLATTLGVTDRFMALKDQRDRARTEAQMLERLSERDTLTGLYNRRVLEERFAALRAEGFTTLALLDLDDFKSINDTFGHGVGDDVLRTVAKAMEPDADTIVVRMGGEEFALLLRGRNAHARAELRRTALTRIVARDVAVDRPVTASMGVIEVPIDAMPDAKFDTLYRRADVLLYEAKAAGRNKMLMERIQAFKHGHPPQPGRRAA
ncbi:hypothetical protein GCM10009127_03780 [Alteraurantiacibacter aestuarii]